LLKITGRVKELFKTSKGKYVAPAPIENLLNSNPLIEQSMVTGVGQPQPCALVVLSENVRPQLGDPAVRERVTAELNGLLTSVNARLADYEQLYRIVVAKEPWTIENGMLTPTMKVKRSRIEAATQDHLDGWYAAKQKVCWAQ
jgi:long-subunit acyl-CoA synthetase (AMP-forming)